MTQAIVTTESKALAPLNATRHGILSRQLVLSWENVTEYDALHDSLSGEYQPQTVTEAHLIEELAGIIWRKRRLRMAESAHYQKEIKASYGDNYTADAALACIIT